MPDRRHDNGAILFDSRFFNYNERRRVITFFVVIILVLTMMSLMFVIMIIIYCDNISDDKDIRIILVCGE